MSAGRDFPVKIPEISQIPLIKIEKSRISQKILNFLNCLIIISLIYLSELSFSMEFEFQIQ